MHTFKGNEIRKKLVAMECHRRFWKVFKKLGMISVPCSESSRTDPYSTFIHHCPWAWGYVTAEIAHQIGAGVGAWAVSQR